MADGAAHMLADRGAGAAAQGAVMRARFTPLEARLASILYDARYGPPLTEREITDAVYADDPDDGPESRVALQVIRRLRPKVRALGCEIVYEHGRGYRLVRGTLEGERLLQRQRSVRLRVAAQSDRARVDRPRRGRRAQHHGGIAR